MINTLTFVGVAMLVEVAMVWIAYAMGVQNGWLQGWEDRRAESTNSIEQG